jgi:type 1 fimbria pilin
MQNKPVKHFYGLKLCRKNAWILKIVSLFALFFLSSSSFAAGVGGCGGEASFPPAYPQQQLIMEPLPIGAPVPKSRVTYTAFSRKASSDPCRISFNRPPTVSNGYKTIYEGNVVRNMTGDCSSTSGECAFEVSDTTQSASLQVNMSLVYVGPPQSGEFVVQMAEGARTTDVDAGTVTYWNLSRPLRVEKACQITANTSSVDFGMVASSQFSGGPGSSSALQRDVSLTVQCGPGTSHRVSFSLQPVGSTFVPNRCVLQPNNNSSIGIDLKIWKGAQVTTCDASGKMDWPSPIGPGTTETLTLTASLVQLSSGLPAGAFQAGLNWVADYK